MSSARGAGAGRVRAPRQHYRAPRRAVRQGLDGAKQVVVDTGWKSRLHQIIDRNSLWKEDGRTPTSEQTRHNLRVGLVRLFSVLVKKYPLEDPAKFDARHLAHLDAWMQERYDRHLAGTKPSLTPATISGYASYLRHFCRWIGQPQMVELVGKGFESPKVMARTSAAQTDRSWEGRGIDIAAKIDQAWRMEPWVGMVLLAQAALGLRRKEAVCLVPATAWDGQFLLRVVDGAKGGRPRTVVLWEDAQFEVLAVLRTWLAEERRQNAALGGGAGDLKQNLRRYQYVLRSIGITRELTGTTGHGLRSGFACRLLAEFGVTAPVRGGDVAAMERETVRAAYTATSEALGHSRLHIVNAYGGSTRHRPELAFVGCQPPDLSAMAKRIESHRQCRREVERLLDRTLGGGGDRTQVPGVPS